MLLTAALILLASATASAEQAPTPSPRFTLDAADPRAPLADSDFGAWDVPDAPAAPKTAATPAPKRAGVAPEKALGRQPVVRGGVPSGFATIEIQQAEDVAENWTVKIDGGTVGKLGKGGHLRVGMVSPGKHRLAIFNERGTLWSGLVEVRGAQTLLLETRLSGLATSDAMAITSDAELQRERVANSR